MQPIPLKTSRLLFLYLTATQLLFPAILFAVRKPVPQSDRLGQTLGYVAVGMLTLVLALVQAVRGQVVTWMKENAAEALAALREEKIPGRVHAQVLMQAAALELVALVAGLALFLGAQRELGAIPLTTFVLSLWVMPTAGSLERMVQD